MLLARYAFAVLVVCLLFLSASALFGGASLILDPSGASLDMPLALLEGTRFSDYRLPGVILFTVLGVAPLPVLLGLLRQPGWKPIERINPAGGMHWSWTATVLIGGALLCWILVQLLLIGYVSVLQPLYAGLAVAILLLAWSPPVRARLQRHIPV